jgi:mRNA interferase RelE/StbE
LVYKILYKNSVRRDLKKLGKPEARRILNQLEAELSKKPESYPVLKGEFAGLHRYRVGDYRIIYALMDEDVVVLRIGHRRDVYR